MLSPETIELCRKSLEADIKRLETWLENNPLTVSESDKEFEGGGALNSWAVKRQNHQASSALLEDCRTALKRMEDGSYGKCPCGNWINPDRIIAHPEASRCRPCQEKVGLHVR